MNNFYKTCELAKRLLDLKTHCSCNLRIHRKSKLKDAIVPKEVSIKSESTDKYNQYMDIIDNQDQFLQRKSVR